MAEDCGITYRKLSSELRLLFSSLCNKEVLLLNALAFIEQESKECEGDCACVGRNKVEAADERRLYVPLTSEREEEEEEDRRPLDRRKGRMPPWVRRGGREWDSRQERAGAPERNRVGAGDGHTSSSFAIQKSHPCRARTSMQAVR